MLIKGYLPIPEFFIEPNNDIKNKISNFERNIYEIHDFNILEKLFYIDTNLKDSEKCKFANFI